MRIACARVADLPLAAELRAHPELRGRPLAIADGATARAELLCVSREAARAARAQALGLPADVAVASSSGVARLAVRGLAASIDTLSCGDEVGEDAEGRVLALSPERERSFLDPLPIDLLDPSDALAEAFTRFGVHTVRDLLALPRRGLATRLGADALELLRLARGEGIEAP